MSEVSDKMVDDVARDVDGRKMHKANLETPQATICRVGSSIALVIGANIGRLRRREGAFC